MKTINILGETQRDQWLTVVRLLRDLGPELPRTERKKIADELERYINNAEDIFDKMREEKQECGA